MTSIILSTDPWCSLLLFTQVLEGLMNVTKFMADHIEIINLAFLSRYFKHLPTFLKIYLVPKLNIIKIKRNTYYTIPTTIKHLTCSRWYSRERN